MGAVFSSSSPQVFINFRGQDVRNDFLDSLVDKMRTENINVFIDKDEVRGLDLEDLFVRIEESKVAIVIFSKNFTNSTWCLNELARIKDCVDRGTLIAIPIFYKMEPSVVKSLTGEFGTAFRTLMYNNRDDPVTEKWEKALVSMTKKHGMVLQEHSDMADREFINNMIKEVKKLLEYIRKKADQRGQLRTIQNIQSEAVQVIRQPEAVQIIPQPESVQNRQPKTVKIQQANVHDQGFMFNARKLRINNSHNPRHWTYVFISESPNEAAIEVAKMEICYDLEVCGEFHARELTFGKRYEVVFVVKVEDTMSRFDILAKTQLMVPDKELQEEELQFVDLIKNEWIEIRAGVFDAWPHKEKIAFYLYQAGSIQKMRGLLVKSAIIRPVKPEVVQTKQPEAIHIPQLNVNHQGCMFNARQLRINNSHNARYWTYVSISESPNEAAIEVAKMVICYDLEVWGEFHARELTSGKRYEVVFVVKVEDTMSRFDILAKTQLMVPDKELQEQKLQFVDLIKNEWIEIRVGVFDARPHNEKIAFYLYQDGSEQKMTGLLVKSAIIRLLN